MTDRDFEQLIALSAEIERMDDPRAVRPRSGACMAMARLSVLAHDSTTETAAETGHLQLCRLCAARLNAFIATYDLAPVTISGGGRRSMWRGWGGLVATAAAACLIMLVTAKTPWPSAKRPVVLTRAHVANSAMFENIRAAGLSDEDEGCDVDAPIAISAYGLPVSLNYYPCSECPLSRRFDCFAPRVIEPVVMLAISRTWDRACSCLVWRVHKWDDGSTVGSADLHTARDLELDVSDSPPVDQMLLLAVARGPESMPTRSDDGKALMECLNSNAPPSALSSDAVFCASTVQACMPQGVTVVPHRFVVARR